jgi:hypothetical protein
MRAIFQAASRRSAGGSVSIPATGMSGYAGAGFEERPPMR